MKAKSPKPFLRTREPLPRSLVWGAWLLLASPFVIFAYVVLTRGHCG